MGHANMKPRRKEEPRTGRTLLNLLLILLIILPFTVAGIWGAIRLHTSIFPVDPDVTMPIFPQGTAFLLLSFLGLIVGGMIGGFFWAAIAKQFMTRDEVYRQALFGVRIPLVTDLNKAYLRWLYRNEGNRR
jgi:hypothetical protein